MTTTETFQRYFLAALGLAAALVLLGVSAAMNWRFGYQLGNTPVDGLIYASASAAADGLKALIPFYLVVAIRERLPASGGAALLVWLIATGYSLTSALGHAALHREDRAGIRAASVHTYADLRDDLGRARAAFDRLPPHRPASVVRVELAALQADRRWRWSRKCTAARSRVTRRHCRRAAAAAAELATATAAAGYQKRISAARAALDARRGSVTQSASDPQAAILSRLVAVYGLNATPANMQLGLVVFVAVMLEVGSGLGLYISLMQFRRSRRARPVPVKSPRLAPRKPSKRKRQRKPPAAAVADAPASSAARPVRWSQMRRVKRPRLTR